MGTRTAHRRLCVRSDGTYQVVVLKEPSGGFDTPACPAGWTDAVGQKTLWEGETNAVSARWCYRQL
jgi:hypothetical protein